MIDANKQDLKSKELMGELATDPISGGFLQHQRKVPL